MAAGTSRSGVNVETKNKKMNLKSVLKGSTTKRQTTQLKMA